MDRNAIRYRGQGIMSENKVKWHPYPQEIPEKENLYIVSIKDRKKSFTSASYWDRKVFGVYWDEDVTAWAELPDPYKELKNG